eukprot:7167048-Prymnesium_polylepis.1
MCIRDSSRNHSKRAALSRLRLRRRLAGALRRGRRRGVDPPLHVRAQPRGRGVLQVRLIEAAPRVEEQVEEDGHVGAAQVGCVQQALERHRPQ